MESERRVNDSPALAISSPELVRLTLRKKRGQAPGHRMSASIPGPSAGGLPRFLLKPARLT